MNKRDFWEAMLSQVSVTTVAGNERDYWMKLVKAVRNGDYNIQNERSFWHGYLYGLTGVDPGHIDNERTFWNRLIVAKGGVGNITNIRDFWEKYVLVTQNTSVNIYNEDQFYNLIRGGGIAPPSGFLFLIDTDGSYLIDQDGYYLTEAA